MASCAACGRPMGNLARRCLYCGAAVAGEPTAPPKHKPVACGCPGCARTLRVVPGEPTACMYCGLAFTAAREPGRPPRLGPAHGGVTPAQIAALTAGLPAARVWQTVRAVLGARAELDELTPGEAEAVLRRLAATLDRPADDGAWWLPLELDEAAALVPRVVLGQADFGVAAEPGRAVVTVVLATRDRSKLPDHGKRLAANAIGLALGVGLGVDLTVGGPEQLTGQTRVQLRIELAAQAGGVALGFANQIDQAPPTPLSAAERDELAGRLAAARARLAGYYLLAAIYGPSCQGATAFSLVREAIAARLTALGCPAPAPLLDVLALRMPAPYPAA